MPQSTTKNNTATEQRTQPWQVMQEVQTLFKSDKPADLGANAEGNKIEEEPLKLNLFRAALNSATTNIADVKEH